MSIFNPWGELRRLKARLASEEQAYIVEETAQQKLWAQKDRDLAKLTVANAELRDTVKRLDAVIADLNAKLAKVTGKRDPKTGRYAKKDK